MPLHLAPFIARWGVAAIALGAGLEGEAVVVTGGALAAAGLVHPAAAAMAAFAGSAVADQLLFFLGRGASHTRFIRRVREKAAFSRALGWIERWPVAFVLAFRFVYGFRVAGPVAIGVSSIPARTFVPLNLVSAAVWAATFTFVGYRFGPAIEQWMHRVGEQLHGPVLTLPALVLVGVLLAIAMVRRRVQLRQE